MEKPTGLADLKLVNKYYPIANYSYPSPKNEEKEAAAAAATAERPGDRSSVDSQSSVPGMVDDRESVISIEDQVNSERDQYHISGAELWDSFWEDPFWEANAEEASHETDSITRTIIHRTTSYPALIPSPDSSCRKDHYFSGDRAGRNGDVIVSAFKTYPSSSSSSSAAAAAIAATTWPLIASEVPVAPRPITPKANYSLFPRATQIVPLGLPSSRSSTLSPPPWETPRRDTGSTVSLTSLDRASRPKRLLLAEAHAAERRSWIQSAPATPLIIGPSPPSLAASASSSASSSSSVSSASSLVSSSSATSSSCIEASTELRNSILLLNQRPRPPVVLPRTRSETIVSRSSVRSTNYPIRAHKSQLDLCTTPPTIPPRPRSPELPPALLTQCVSNSSSGSNRCSQAEMPVKIHTQIPLHRCRTETNLLTLRQRRSQASLRTMAGISTCTITPVVSSSCSLSPRPPPPPEPVSVFEEDSDSEVEESFARRIARTICNASSSSKRTRSASAAPRSRKGNEVAKGQLSRARAETLETSSVKGLAIDGEKSGSSVVGQPGALLRRQKSEVFGKMLWGRR